MTLKRFAAFFIAFMTLFTLCSCRMNIDNGSDEVSRSQYGGLFDTSKVHEINVEISEEDWEDLLAHPLEKTKYHASVTIDGNRVENVSFATKGNTSLSMVASSDSDRYSFKINFGKYNKKQTYFGLDKLNLNNIMSDATYMKDYLSYTIMREAGVPSPLISYVSLKINGELHGLYIAIEEIDGSFLERNLGTKDCALYKPEDERLDNDNAGAPENGMPGGDMPDMGFPISSGMPGNPPDGFQPGMNMPDNSGEPMTPPDGFNPGDNMPDNSGMPMTPPDEINPGSERPGEGGNGGQGQFPSIGGSSAGADLKYTDDDPDSYSAIFDNCETDVTDTDKSELIAALKALSTGDDVDKYWDIDELVRYFAAHNFVQNYDSYTGNMLHNYYLCENSGKVSVYPWDYNLAFCGFARSDDAASMINQGIDTPLLGASEEARPLWNAVVSSEEYLESYHKVYDELLKSFFESGKCKAEIETISEMIRPYVANDPTAFYTEAQFEEAVEMLKKVCELRAESIRLQLDGKLALKTEEQNEADRVSAEGVSIEVMGTQGGGKGGPGEQGSFPGGDMGRPGGSDMQRPDGTPPPRP